MSTTKEESALLATHAREYFITAQEREELRLAKESDTAAFQRMREQYAASIPAYEEVQEQRRLERAGMSEEQRKRHEALDFARANVELSGGKISEEAAKRGLRWANGESPWMNTWTFRGRDEAATVRAGIASW